MIRSHWRSCPNEMSQAASGRPGRLAGSADSPTRNASLERLRPPGEGAKRGIDLQHLLQAKLVDVVAGQALAAGSIHRGSGGELLVEFTRMILHQLHDIGNRLRPLVLG